MTEVINMAPNISFLVLSASFLVPRIECLVLSSRSLLLLFSITLPCRLDRNIPLAYHRLNNT